MIKYNSRDIKYKKPYGAVPEGMRININVHASREMGVYKLFLHVVKDGGSDEKNLPMNFIGFEGSNDIYSVTFSLEEGLYWYNFYYSTSEDSKIIIGRNEENSPVLGSEQVWQLTVYKEDFITPEWIKGGIMYQIFPDRFCRSSAYEPVIRRGAHLREDWGGMPERKEDAQGNIPNNDFFGGNLDGIIEKLDYIKELGVNCIYLNPIFEAASNHKYDTGDYEKIDSMFGNEIIFERLCREADKKGIGIILDGVFSHTGSDSRYFNKEGRYSEAGAYQSKSSEFYPWYSFINWPDSYKSWWGVGILPEVKEEEPSYMEYIAGKNGIVSKWIRAGAKGYRLDVADELPDVFLDKLRERVKAEDSEALIIGEVWEDASNKVSYGNRRRYLRGKQLDSVMNYVFRSAILDFVRYGDGYTFAQRIESILENYPEESVNSMMNILGTHDTRRLLTELGSISKLKSAVILQYFLPGVPCVFYGDEAGMTGEGDPFCRGCYPWGKENKELLAFYRALGKIRNKNKDVLKSGKYFTNYVNQDIMCYIRTNGEKSIYVLSNSSESPYVLSASQMGLNIEKTVRAFDLINNFYIGDKIKLEGNGSTVLISERKERYEKQSSGNDFSFNNGNCDVGMQ